MVALFCIFIVLKTKVCSHFFGIAEYVYIFKTSIIHVTSTQHEISLKSAHLSQYKLHESLQALYFHLIILLHSNCSPLIILQAVAAISTGVLVGIIIIFILILSVYMLVCTSMIKKATGECIFSVII